MNPFFLRPDEQIAEWKLLREEIKLLDDDAAFQRVAEYWGDAPLLKMAYDPEDCTEWPSPWEMVAAGDWCPFSVAIGMEFTLRLAGWDPERMELVTIRDYNISEQKMILKIDGRIALNYSVGTVEAFPESNFDVLAAFKNDGKRYSSIT